MQPAPPVQLRVGQQLGWRLLQAALGALAGAAPCAWAALWLEWAPAGVAAAAAVGALLLGAVLWGLGRPLHGVLAWTGSQWQWRPDSAPATPLRPPDVVLDLDSRLLLRLRPAERRAAFWVAAGAADVPPGQWAAFRAAVYSPASRTGERPARGRHSP